MAGNQKQIWNGGSGRGYEFSIYTIDAKFSQGQNGNYIFAKQSLVAGWVAVYIGEGDLKTRIDAHRIDGCITEKGATHIYAHINIDDNSRKEEESDLLIAHAEAYEPIGCNVKIGG